MSQAAAAETPARANLSDWLAVGAGTLGALMAMVDVSIVNASLPVIQGEIGATPSEGTWVSTAYLIAEVVIIPLTGWLERVMGMRRLLLAAAFMFTVFSMVCGLAVSLMTIIVGRIGQGLAGGILIPTAMTIVARRLPASQQSIGLALIAMTALTGPAIGPLLGGWLTDTFSWRFIFFLNLPVCLFMLGMLVMAIPREPGDLRELRNADWLGIFGMIFGLGSLTTLLEKGHTEQWFQSTLIVELAIAGAVGLAMIAVGQFGSRRPVVRLALLANASLASCVALMTIVGMLLYSCLFIAPQFLVAVAGYNAMQAGKVVFWSGLISIPVAFVYPLLVTRIDMRVLVGFAILILGVSNLLVSGMTVASTGSAFLLSQALFGTGTTLSSMPLMQSSMNSVHVDDVAESNSLMSVARNLGGAIGLAAMASFQEQRFELHRWTINGAMPANDGEVQRQLADASAMFGGGPDGLTAAYQSMDGQAAIQAMVMMFNDLYLVLGVIALLFVPSVLFLRPSPPGSTVAAFH